MRPDLVDFHCHLDLYKDHVEVIRECDRNRVATLAVTTTPKTWRRNLEIASGSEFVRVALGLHPQLVEDRGGEVALFEKLLPETRYVGEVGLDAGPRFYRTFADQERVFVRILKACSEQRGKIISIHSIRAASKVLNHLETHLTPDRGKAILHWFTGTSAEANRAVDLGCYFSINQAMTGNPKLVSILASLPADRLLTETDGPFTDQHGQPTRPKDVSIALAKLATVRNLPLEEMRRQVLTNLKTLVEL